MLGYSECMCVVVLFAVGERSAQVPMAGCSGERSAEVPITRCRGAGSMLWKRRVSCVREMVQMQECVSAGVAEDDAVMLGTRQHCRFFPSFSLGLFRAQEGVCLCWGDPGCGESELNLL